jgi:hypothetical protein
MATYEDSLGFNKGTTATYPEKGTNATTMISIDLDMAAITAARLAAGATALADNDILEVIRIPAKTLVLAAGLDVTTAEGGTCTIDVGDGATVDGFLDGVNANTVASYCSTLSTEAYDGGKYYAAADTIDVKFINAADTAVMRVWALLVDCND